jgi:hypothetical protein
MNSIGTLYIDCPEQEKNGAFDAGKNISEEEYVKMLREYSKTIGLPSPKQTYSNKHFNSYDMDEYVDEKKTYSKSKTRIFNISGNLCDINEIRRIQKNGMGVIIFDILKDEMEEYFESEFKFWKRDSMNINNDKTIDKDDRIRFLPTKDLKFEIDNHMFLLNGCKIYCDYDTFKVAIIIQKINEI